MFEFKTLRRFFRWLNSTGLKTLHGAIVLWKRTTQKDKLRLIALASLIFGLVYIVNWSPWAREFTPEVLQEKMALWRGWAGAAYATLYAIGSCMCVPQTPMIQVGAMSFGWVLGGILALAGMTLGALGSYWIAVAFGTNVVRHALGPSYDTVQRHMRTGLELNWSWLQFLRRGPFALVPQSFWGIALLRLLSVPFPAVSYIAGVMRVPFGPFITGTIVGAAPSAFLFALLFTQGIAWLPYLLDHWTLIIFGVPLILLSVYFAAYLAYYHLRFGRERFCEMIRVPQDEECAKKQADSQAQ